MVVGRNRDKRVIPSQEAVLSLGQALPESRVCLGGKAVVWRPVCHRPGGLKLSVNNCQENLVSYVLKLFTNTN